MSRKLLRVAPLAVALLILAVPVRDLATRLRSWEASEKGDHDGVQSQGPVRDAAGGNPAPDDAEAVTMPGTILREERTSRGTDLVLSVGSLETARLFDYLNRVGTTRSISLEQGEATGWIARITLHPSNTDITEFVTAASPDRDATYSTDKLAQVFALPAVHNTRSGGSLDQSLPLEPAPTDQASAVSHRTGSDGPTPFGTVRFYSGRRFSWRWNSDVLLLEDMP